MCPAHNNTPLKSVAEPGEPNLPSGFTVDVTADVTATTTGARAHARAQAGTIHDAMPAVPAYNWPQLPSDLTADQLTWAEGVPSGSYTSVKLGRGTRFRLVDVDGTACVSVMMWRADAPWERLNTADTVKVPWQAYLGTGHPLLSDQGRVLATIVADSSGHHDALCGVSTLSGNTARYGAGAPESPTPAGRELLALAAAKNGLSERDIAHPISFFHGIRADSGGGLHSIGNARPGAAVDFLVHLPVLVAIVHAPHPLDPDECYSDGNAHFLAWNASLELDELVSDTEREPEFLRAVANSEAIHAANG